MPGASSSTRNAAAQAGLALSPVAMQAAKATPEARTARLFVFGIIAFVLSPPRARHRPIMVLLALWGTVRIVRNTSPDAMAFPGIVKHCNPPVT